MKRGMGFRRASEVAVCDWEGSQEHGLCDAMIRGLVAPGSNEGRG
jgi:hypothetical protein